VIAGGVCRKIADGTRVVPDAGHTVRFSKRDVSRREMTVVDGRLALVGEEFADDMKGWALVRVIDDRCSPQTIVTRCTLYEQYTTDETN